MSTILAIFLIITAVLSNFIEFSSQSKQQHPESGKLSLRHRNKPKSEQRQVPNEQSLQHKQRGRQTGPLPWQPESPDYTLIHEIPDLEVPDGRPKSYQGKIFGMEKDGDIHPIKRHGEYVLLIQPHNIVEIVSFAHWAVVLSNYVDEEKARRQALKNAIAAVHAGEEGVVYHEPQTPSPIWNPNEI